MDTKWISLTLFTTIVIAIWSGYYLYHKFSRYYRRHRISVARSTLPSFEPFIVIIGAGLSGICTAIKLEKELGYSNFIILERNKEVGGTWYTNTYPGCACDIPSYLYCYSFEQKHDWVKAKKKKKKNKKGNYYNKWLREEEIINNKIQRKSSQKGQWSISFRT